jgi:hypothetical protein
VYLANGTSIEIKTFINLLKDRLGRRITKFPQVMEATFSVEDMADVLAEVYEPESEEVEVVVPEELKKYRLNVNTAAKKGEDEFFLTTIDREYVAPISGRYYISRCKIPLLDAYTLARPVIPVYLPRSGPGVIERKDKLLNVTINHFNTYVPPEWAIWRKENPVAWKKLPKKPPVLLMKLLQHLIPIKKERQYLCAWLYASMTSRSYVYLILCGAPGAGKNRLKLLMRALHGAGNTVDGKKSTLTERFNSQLSRGTLTWFDELKYDSDMENVMKEIQNDYLSIERKGIDATSSSEIYASMAISNNKPRDNFIAFDARKFAPLVLGSSNLQNSMTIEEIEEFTKRVEVGKPDFDVKYVAQIAKWLESVGPYNYSLWPTLEYRGPMFWTLAHTSMSRWQKKAVSTLIDNKTGIKIGWDEKRKSHLWSKVEEKIGRKDDKGLIFPDYSSVKAFFDVFRDGEGRKAFETTMVEGNNILGDFWIKPLIKDIEIITEAHVIQQRNKEASHGKEDEIYEIE